MAIFYVFIILFFKYGLGFVFLISALSKARDLEATARFIEAYLLGVTLFLAFLPPITAGAQSLPREDHRKAAGDKDEVEASPAPSNPPLRYHATNRYNVTRSPSQLLAFPSIQKELKISPSLMIRINSSQLTALPVPRESRLATNLRNARLRWRQALVSGDAAKIASARGELDRATIEKDRALSSRDRAALSLLSPSQRKRLIQIFIRYLGIRALANPEIALQVGLTEDQVAEIQGILAFREREVEGQRSLTENNEESRRIASEFNRVVSKSRAGQHLTEGDHRVLMEFAKRSKIREGERDRFELRVDEHIARILTRFQRQQFNKMLGPYFDLRLLDENYNTTGDAKREGNRDSKVESDAHGKTTHRRRSASQGISDGSPP